MRGTESLFHARPRWQRVMFRAWRLGVLQHLPSKQEYAYIVPPREWSQEQANAVIKRGQELAEKYGW